MKCLIETTGPFFLLMPDAKVIRHEGYTLVNKADVTSNAVVFNQTRSVAEVNDEATDEEWLKYVKESDGDLELAVASFVSSFPADGKPTQAAAPEKRASSARGKSASR